MPVSAGDVVYNFLGETTDIDRAFTSVDTRAAASAQNLEHAWQGVVPTIDEINNAIRTLPPVPPEVPESIKLTAHELREAKGEARLLGEAIGVRLPRHVSTFLAELPGVSNLLSSAFSATAIVYLAGALVDVTKKGSDFVANNLILTQSMKDSNEATVEANKVLLELAEKYNQAKESIQNFGAKGTDSIRLQLAANQKQLETLKQSLTAGEDNTQQQRQITHEYITQTGWLSKGYDWIHAIATGSRTQIDTIKQQTAAIQNGVVEDNAKIKAIKEQNELLEKQLEAAHRIETIKQGGEEKSAGLKARAAQAEAEVAEDSQTAEKRKRIAEQLENDLYKIKRSGMLQELAILREDNANTLDQQAALLSKIRVAADEQMKVVADRLKAAKDDLQKSLQDIAKTVQEQLPEIQIITPIAIQNMIKGTQAAHALGVTLRGDLVLAYQAALKAQQDFMASGTQDTVAMRAVSQNVKNAQQALENYGKTEDHFKARSHGLWAEFRQDTKSGATAMDQTKQLGVTAFDDLSRGMEQAIATAILAQGSFSQALERATASALASIASQALVKSLFYTGEGFAALAAQNYTGATQFFESAGIMAAVGAAAGIAAHAMSGGGGGGSSSNTQQGNNSQSNTTSQAGRSGSSVGVQHFATGGLITQPTLSMMGEQNRKEAVLPLEDPRAMKEIGKAIGGAGGSGVTVHVHGHVIGAADVAHLAGQISKRVSRGQAYLKSSNTLRVTKRSA